MTSYQGWNEDNKIMNDNDISSQIHNVWDNDYKINNSSNKLILKWKMFRMYLENAQTRNREGKAKKNLAK